jgi:hypothetical protein
MKGIFFETAWQVGIWSDRHDKWIIYTFKTEQEALKFYHKEE